MTAALPEGWDVAPIGSVARVVGGGTPPSHDPDNFAAVGHGIPWVTPADLSGYRSQSISRGARDLSETGLARCGATLMPKGTVLFSSRAPIGYVAIAANEISTNQGFKSFVLPAEIDPRFVYWQLKHLKPEAEAIATGTTFKELSGAAAATLPLRIAPAPEQTRIADKLDTLLARIQACQDRLEAIPALLKRFRQAVLSSALSGELTEAWRAEQGIGIETWLARTIADVAEVGTGSTPLRSNSAFYADAGTPWVTSAATSRAYIDSADQHVTKAAITAHRLKVYRPGTLIVAMYGEGKTRGQVSELRIDATINQACAAITVDQQQAIAVFVKLVLSSQYAQTRALAEGGAQPNLNLSKVRGIALRVPGLLEQSEIVRRVGDLFAFADNVESHVAEAVGKARRLSSLTLSKAFRGELVPQDPNDEPASALLARIAAQRNAPTVAAAKRTPRRARPPRAPKESAAMTKSRQDDDVMGQPYLAGHLRRIGMPASAVALFDAADLPVGDFYKQLAWEVAQGHVKDNQTTLEPGHAAG